MQEEGLTNEGRHHLLLLHKQVQDKSGIAESLHAQITRARLPACEVGVFFRDYSIWGQIHHTKNPANSISLFHFQMG